MKCMFKTRKVYGLTRKLKKISTTKKNKGNVKKSTVEMSLIDGHSLGSTPISLFKGSDCLLIWQASKVSDSRRLEL